MPERFHDFAELPINPDSPTHSANKLAGGSWPPNAPLIK
jgi:hypothetical protein